LKAVPGSEKNVRTAPITRPRYRIASAIPTKTTPKSSAADTALYSTTLAHALSPNASDSDSDSD
jgi:hypothetical protein